MTTVPRTALQIRSLVKPNGELELSLAEFEVPIPGDAEVLVRVEASPINPSDQGLLFAGADLLPAVDAIRDRISRVTDVITVGGPHVSAQPERTLELFEAFDYGVVGEGERSYPELIARLA